MMNLTGRVGNCGSAAAGAMNAAKADEIKADEITRTIVPRRLIAMSEEAPQSMRKLVPSPTT
jgi:hypothetical protein